MRVRSLILWDTEFFLRDNEAIIFQPLTSLLKLHFLFLEAIHSPQGPSYLFPESMMVLEL